MNHRIRFVFAVLCLSLAAAAWGQTRPIPLGRQRPEVMQAWQTSLDEANASLQAGKWKKAKQITDRLALEMTHQIQSGAGLESLIALPVVLRAVAEAGLGNMEAAEWDWYAAQTIHPDAARYDLTPYGAAGAALRALPPIDPDRYPKIKGPTCVAPDDPCQKIEKPRLIAHPYPKFPQALSIACIPGQLVVGMTLDEQGRPHQPRLVESPQIAVLSLATLEAVRHWRFEPATLDGVPAKVQYSLTVNFKVPVCTNLFAKPAPEEAPQEKPDGDETRREALRRLGDRLVW